MTKITEQQILQNTALCRHRVASLPQTGVHLKMVYACADCALSLRVSISGAITGNLLWTHCLGQAITFDEAKALYARGYTKGRRSMELESNVRLVELAGDTYAVQAANTYLIRIKADGTYEIETASYTVSPFFLRVLSNYSPLKLTTYGSGFRTQHGERFTPSMRVDAVGHLIKPDTLLVNTPAPILSQVEAGN